MKHKDLVRVIVNIYGEDYIVRGSEDPHYIEKLAAYVDRRMMSIAQRNPNLGTTKVAVLTALNIADEMGKLQEDYDQLIKTMEEMKNKASEG
ncbi:MAG: cell division protein ZapA [Solirubrobacterales bacterium]